MSAAAPILVDSPSCCSLQADADAALCPVSASIGLKVDLITLKTLLTPGALRRLDGKAYRFCPEPDCEVVYFDREADSIFGKPDLVVRVGQKETDDPIPVCYCFGITVADLRRDIAAEGETSIPATITAQMRAGRCACELKNPQGSGCLGNVSNAVKRIQIEVCAETV